MIAEIEHLRQEVETYKRKFREVLVLVSDKILYPSNDAYRRPICSEREHPNCVKLQEIVDREALDGVLAT